jgi:Holliday junction DNA helicase RuvA
MIAYLEGVIKFIEPDRCVVLTGGIGYGVHAVGWVPNLGEEVRLHILDYIREDRRELFGFEDHSMLALFKRLIDISGVGPKLAQKILSAHSANRMTQIIMQGDLASLTSISGVGKKTAQKIILELKGVLVTEEVESGMDSDTLEALLSLGYQREDCTEILLTLTAESPEERIREALQLLDKTV